MFGQDHWCCNTSKTTALLLGVWAWCSLHGTAAWLPLPLPPKLYPPTYPHAHTRSPTLSPCETNAEQVRKSVWPRQ